MDDNRLETISRLVEGYSRRLVAYSRLICRDADLARDAASETFLKLCELDNIDERSIGAWLYRTCRNQTIDILRKRRFIAEFDELQISELAEEPANSDCMQKEYLLSLISKLPQRQQEILMLRYFSQLKYSEIAEALDISSANVGVYISRALETLKRQMQDENRLH